MTLLRECTGMGLTEAKRAVDRLLDGESIRLEIEDEAMAFDLRRRAEALGVLCVSENDTFGNRG
jgi:ribosomal protein L7/L12